MTKNEKIDLVQKLAEEFKAKPNFYLVDASGFSAGKTHEFREKCHASNIKVRVIKNTLIKKSLESIGGEYTGIFEVLKEQTMIMFANENANQPAKIIKAFRETNDRPKLKGAYIEETAFVGDHLIDQLASLKSKRELIADVVALLQSPAKNTISALQSSGQKLASILTTLSER